MPQHARFRYEGFTRWWKGNLHVHSTRSDGGKSPAELVELYAGAGYDFIVLADHGVAGVPDDLPRPSPLTVLDGVELDGDDSTGANFHVVCIGCRGGIDRTMGLEAGMAEARRQGAVLVLAHPTWNGGWVHVDAPAPTPAALIAAIRAGRFVSSRGPVIRRLAGTDGASLTEGTLAVPDDWAHARIEIEDEAGRRAWTNALFS